MPQLFKRSELNSDQFFFVYSTLTVLLILWMKLHGVDIETCLQVTQSKALSQNSNSKSKLLLGLSGSRSSSNNGKPESMVAEGSGVAKQTVGGVGGGQLNSWQLDGLGSSGDGRGSQEAAVQAVAIDSGGVHIVDGAGDQGVVAVLGLLQLNQLGVSRGVRDKSGNVSRGDGKGSLTSAKRYQRQRRNLAEHVETGG